MDTKQESNTATESNAALQTGSGAAGSRKKKKIIIGAVLLVVVVGVILYLIFGRNRLSATTMRIIRYEGDVTLLDNGKENTLMENMLLHNGNMLSTELKSYIDISLDDTKIVGLDEQSRAEFYQSGKKLDIALKAGGIYFYTTEKLKDDETFDIRTATMIVGIRGTSGYVHVDEETGVTTLTLTSGKVHIIGNNPVTGGTREADITAGQRVTTYLYNDRQGQDSIEFVIESFTEKDIPIHYIKRMVKVPSLLKEVEKETGLSADLLTTIAQTATDGQGAGETLYQDDGDMADDMTGSGEDDENAADAADGDGQDVPADDGQGKEDASNETASQESDGRQGGRTERSPQGRTNTTQPPQGGTRSSEGETGSSPASGGTQGSDGESGSQDQPSYTVTIKETAGGSVSAGAASAKQGDTVTLTASPEDGYTLGSFTVTDRNGNEVSVTDKETNQAEFVMPAGNVTVKASFKKKTVTYKITVRSAAGGKVTASLAKAKKGKKITLTAAPEDGYELSSFSVKDKNGKSVTVTKKGTNQATFTMPASKVTVSAKFKKTESQKEQTYTITMQTATGGSISAGVSVAKAGETVTLTASMDDGYELESVSVTDEGGSSVATTAGSSANVVTFTMPAKNVTVTPSFKQTAAETTEQTYMITIQTVTGGSISAGVSVAKAGETVTLTASMDDGYELESVSVTDEGGSSVATTAGSSANVVTFTMPAKNVTVTPAFKRIYGITIPTVANAEIKVLVGGSESSDKKAYAQDQVTIKVKPAAGYELDSSTLRVNVDNGGGVTLSSPETDGEGYITTSFTMPSGDVTFAAPTLSKISYSITHAAVANASIATSIEGKGSVTTAQIGDTVSVTVTPDTGYSVNSITVSDGSSESIDATAGSFTMPAANVTVIADVVKTEYDLTFRAENGTITAKVNDSQVTKATYQDEVTLQITPNAGYKLESVSVTDAGGSSVSTTVGASADIVTFTMPASAITVTASLAKIDYTISWVDPAEATISVMVGSSSVESAQVGDQVTVEITKNPDFDEYQISTFNVTDSNGAAVSATRDSVLHYSFTMPASDVEIDVTFMRVMQASLNVATDWVHVESGSTEVPLYIKNDDDGTIVAQLNYVNTSNGDLEFANEALGLYATQNDNGTWLYTYVELDEDSNPVAIRATQDAESRLALFETYEDSNGSITYSTLLGDTVTLDDGESRVQLKVMCYYGESYELTFDWKE